MCIYTPLNKVIINQRELTCLPGITSLAESARRAAYIHTADPPAIYSRRGVLIGLGATPQG
jgi:hypothetical protein